MNEYIMLNNGVKMPRIGYGVYQIPSVITEKCVNDALSALDLGKSLFGWW